MPFFVRGDDAEYGMRDPDRKFMSMNGICIWHMSFGHSKFNAFNETYLAIRNLLIMKAILPSCSDVAVYKRLFKRNAEIELRKFNYGYVEMMCDGVEDYLKGPDWLMGKNPEEILMEESAKMPKVVTFEEKLSPSVTRLYETRELEFKDKVRMRLTHNGHVHCSDSKMTAEPGIMLNEFRTIHESRIFMHKEIWFVNDDMATGYKTHIDRDRYTVLVKRIARLDGEMAKNNKRVAQEWRDAYPTLVNEDFWVRFLSMGVEGDGKIYIGEFE